MSDSFSHFTIHKNSTLKQALLQMTSTHRGVLLVIDSDLNLVGVLADGDVRRALLEDVSLSIPITQVMNLNPVVASNRLEAERMIDENPYLIVVPIVNKNGKMTGLLSALNGDDFHSAGELSESHEDDSQQLPNKEVKYLAIIPARGGSKRIPGKNLAKIDQHSLLSLAIKSARESDLINDIIVSTDSDKIAAEATSHGVDVPWLRPADLSGDKAQTVDVMLHAIEKFVEINGYQPKNVVLLEPTAPLRTAKMIDQAIELFEKSEVASSLVSVNKIRHIYHPEEILRSDPRGFLKPYLKHRTFDSRKGRLEQETLYVQNGLVYITKSETLSEKKSIYGTNVLKFETNEAHFADIDEPVDLEIAKIKFRDLFNQTNN